MERVDVVSDGDLVLVVGNKIELRVYSLVLRMNSPVMRAMLGPNWSEGQAFAGSTSCSPGRLDLPDDDHEAMKLLCLVLHSQYGKITHHPAPFELRAFGITVDKYDCLMAVRPVTETWLPRIEASKLARDDRVAVLHATYLLDNAECFSDFTRDIIENTECSWYEADHQAADVGNQIMVAVADTYDELYERVCGYISEVVESFAGALSPEYEHFVGYGPGISADDLPEDEDNPSLCDHYMKMVHIQQRAMAKAKLWPRSCRPEKLAELVANVKDFKSPESLLSKDPNCTWHSAWLPQYKNYHSEGEFAIVTWLKEETECMEIPMCLDCYKAGGKFEGTCRVTHQKELCDDE